jgi:hypothetical protein
MSRSIALALAALSISAAGLAAQTRPEVKLPPSPRGSAEIQVGGAWKGTGDTRQYSGGSWITVDYGRPILRGRENIFGSGATYGQAVSDGAPIWRAGANETTRLTTQATLVVGTTTLAPGVYNVLVDLKESGWTLVLTNQPAQTKYDPNEKILLYGAYNYNPKFDVARTPMRMSTVDTPVEQFTIGFVGVQADSASLYMAWDRTVAIATFAVK